MSIGGEIFEVELPPRDFGDLVIRKKLSKSVTETVRKKRGGRIDVVF